MSKVLNKKVNELNELLHKQHGVDDALLVHAGCEEYHVERICFRGRSLTIFSGDESACYDFLTGLAHGITLTIKDWK